MNNFEDYWEKEQLRRIKSGYSASQKRHRTIFKFIESHSSNSKDKIRVLNIGVGSGFLENLLNTHGYQVYCLDPSEKAVKALQVKYGLSENNCKGGGVENIPFDAEFFDFVVMSEVIEHLSEDILDKGLAEIVRVLKKQGVFLGTVPCNEDLSRETFLCPNCMQSFHRVGHVKSYTPETLRKSLNRYLSVLESKRFTGMTLNWKGYLLHQWNDLPFKIARLVKPNIRAPHQIEFNIFFAARKVVQV